MLLTLMFIDPFSRLLRYTSKWWPVSVFWSIKSLNESLTQHIHLKTVVHVTSHMQNHENYNRWQLVFIEKENSNNSNGKRKWLWVLSIFLYNLNSVWPLVFLHINNSAPLSLLDAKKLIHKLNWMTPSSIYCFSQQVVIHKQMLFVYPIISIWRQEKAA